MQKSSPNPISNMGRGISLKYPSNVFIIIIALAAGVVVGVYELASGTGIGDSVGRAVTALFTAFVTWALGRELDPDHPFTANLAAVIALLGMFVWNAPEILATYGIMWATRIVNRSTGYGPAKGDFVLSVIGAGALAWYTELWIPGIAIALAYFYDAAILKEGRQAAFTVGVLALIATLIGYLLADLAPINPTYDAPAVIAVTVVCIAFFALIMTQPRTVISVGDMTHEPLEFSRILAAQLLTLICEIAAVIWLGDRGMIAFVPLWAIYVSFIIRYIRVMVN
jgi:hypothetical protein